MLLMYSRICNSIIDRTRDLYSQTKDENCKFISGNTFFV